ncbi:MAG: hypothetical protein MUD04_09595 [Cyanobium sp. Prado107]|jgi:hypothetical protein|nr:hypothetical protein [Cyanobium sp. Prado107]
MAELQGDVLARFAQEHHLDYGILQGQPYSSRGSRHGLSTDRYSLEAGLLQNCLTESTVSDCISGLRLTTCKRFANSLLQLTHANMVAQSLGVQRLHLPGFWYLQEGIHTSTSGLEIRNTPQLDLSSDVLVLSGSFLKMKALRPLCRPRRVNPRKMLRTLRPLLKLDVNADPYRKNDLVIHIRSGDIFVTPHPAYGQPPLAFYKKVVRSRPWNTVRVVFEDRLNPVITPLLEWLPQHCSAVQEVSGSLKDDLDVLLRARAIVCGNGTFIRGIAALSRNLKRIYHWQDKCFNTWGNRRLKTVSIQDSLGTYTKAICQHNWHNTADQRGLMLTYPEAALSLENPIRRC